MKKRSWEQKFKSNSESAKNKKINKLHLSEQMQIRSTNKHKDSTNNNNNAKKLIDNVFKINASDKNQMFAD